MDQFTTRLRSARDALIPRLLSAPLPVAEDGPLRPADGRGESRYPLRRTHPPGIRDRRVEGTADPLEVSRMVTVPAMVRVPPSGLTRLGEHAFRRERMSLGNEVAR